jgi:hypothetical protein
MILLLLIQELVTVEKPVLESLPTSTKWLVVHGLYNVYPTNYVTSEDQAGVEITCYEKLGLSWKALRLMGNIFMLSGS